MTTRYRRVPLLGKIGWTGGCALALALAAGCGDGGSPEGAADMATGGGHDMAMSEEARPTVVPVSMDGHDRFFGVAYAPDGSFYAAGVVADGTAATADFKTVVAKFSAAGELDKGFGNSGFAIHNAAVGAGGEVM